MTDPNPATNATRIGIEFLTLWNEVDRKVAATHIVERLTAPDAPDPLTVIVGLLNLSELILLTLARESGAEAENLRTWAAEWLQTHSPQLPE
jgi:hypothetical protein